MAVVGPGDAVVEQPPAVTQPAAQEPEVRRVVLDADVLGQPDRADRVEAHLAHVAVVAVPHLRGTAEPLLGDGLAGPRGLLLRERDTERGDAVVLDGVPHHAAPAAADVQQAHARPEVQLAADQVVLGRLRLLEAGVRGRVAGAGVGHRRPEQHLVERVGHVVVVGDRPGVARAGVPQPVDQPQPLRRALLRGQLRRLDHLPAEHLRQLGQLAHRGALERDLVLQQLEQRVGVGLVDTLDGEVALDVGAGQAQAAGGGGDVAQPPLVEQPEVDVRVRVTRGGPVVRREPDGDVRPEQLLECLSDQKGHRRLTALS